MPNGEELTQFNSTNPTTITALQTLETVSLDDNTVVAGSDFSAPSPVDLSAVDLVKKATTQNVQAGTINDVNISAPASVSYTQVSTSDAITNESLNRTAESLMNSINEKLGAFATSSSSATNTAISEIKSALTNLVNSTNAGFAKVKTENDDQVTEIDQKIDGAVTEINDVINQVRQGNINQNLDIASKMNQLSGETKANLSKLLAALQNIDKKVQALDDVYMTDADMAERITSVNALIETLRNGDLDIVDVLKGTVNEINGLERQTSKEVTLMSAGGVYNFNLVNEGFPQFTSSADYTIEAEVIGNSKVAVSIENKTKDDADLIVKSCGVHFVPQPIDGSVTPVKILVKITHAKLNPLTFNVDTLDSAWVTAGNGTDTNAI